MEKRLFTKNFTLLVLGQASSLFGNYILRLALSMYVLEVTGSAAMFAGILSVATVPTILLSPLGGILADRADRRKIMVALDALTGTAVFCAAVCLSRENALAVIGILLVVLSVLGAFETPTVQACIPQMLAGDDIIRGNAVVNQVASVSYLIAPLLGGILYAAFGLKPVMYASVVCFFLTALLECFIRLGIKPRDHHGTVLSIVKEDFLGSIRFIHKEQPDIVLMDLNLGVSNMDGILLSREIRIQTDAKVLILTALDTPDMIFKAAEEAFASGYIFKSQMSFLVENIRATAEGHTAQEYLIASAALSCLSEAEKAVFAPISIANSRSWLKF